jgi:hypothetical protein
VRQLAAATAITIAVAAVGLGAAGFSGRPPGFTLAGPENLMYSDIQRDAALVKPQLIAMCRGVPARPLTTPNDLDSAWETYSYGEPQSTGARWPWPGQS